MKYLASVLSKSCHLVWQNAWDPIGNFEMGFLNNDIILETTDGKENFKERCITLFFEFCG